MKYLRQFGIILCVSFLGEFLHMALPAPIPASIYGLVIMLVLLFTDILKVEQIRTTAMFLVEIMPVMFVPAGVGLMESWGVLKPILAKVIVITMVSTILVMVVAGRVTQYFVQKKGGQDHDADIK